jgi:hypothetical protein
MFWKFVKKNLIPFGGLLFFFTVAIGVGIGFTATGIFAPLGASILGLMGAAALLFAISLVPALLLGILLRRKWVAEGNNGGIEEFCENYQNTQNLKNPKATSNLPKQEPVEITSTIESRVKDPTEHVSTDSSSLTTSESSITTEEQNENEDASTANSQEYPPLRLPPPKMWSLPDDNVPPTNAVRTETTNPPAATTVLFSPLSQPSASSSSPSSTTLTSPKVTQAQAETVAVRTETTKLPAVAPTSGLGLGSTNVT